MNKLAPGYPNRDTPAFASAVVAVLVVVLILVLVVALILVVLVLVVALILILVLVLVGILVLVIHGHFLHTILSFAACRGSSVPRISAFILCFKEDSCQ